MSMEGAEVIWWLIPLAATLVAWAWTSIGPRRGRLGPRPEPGTAEDAADLARFTRALERPLPGDAR